MKQVNDARDARSMNPLKEDTRMVTTHKDGTVEFAFFRPTAQSVKLVGDFSGWMAGNFQLTKDSGGWWSIRMELPAGEYRFKYLVDNGVWEADFAAYGVEPDRMGGWNSVLYVAPAAEKKSAKAA